MLTQRQSDSNKDYESSLNSDRVPFYHVIITICKYVFFSSAQATV